MKNKKVPITELFAFWAFHIRAILGDYIFEMQQAWHRSTGVDFTAITRVEKEDERIARGSRCNG